jgi:hypothetical protein
MIALAEGLLVVSALTNEAEVSIGMLNYVWVSVEAWLTESASRGFSGTNASALQNVEQEQLHTNTGSC